MTRIRTWVVAATTQSTNHYTITASVCMRVLETLMSKMKTPMSEPQKISSPAGNRTPVSRVTGADTYHYTTEECGEL